MRGEGYARISKSAAQWLRKRASILVRSRRVATSMNSSSLCARLPLGPMPSSVGAMAEVWLPSDPPPVYPTPCPKCKTVHAEHNEAVCLLRRNTDINQSRGFLESHSAKPQNKLSADLLLPKLVIGLP